MKKLGRKILGIELALILLCVMVPSFVLSQFYITPLKPEINLDSLLHLSEDISVIDRIHAYNTLAFHYSFSSEDSCKLYAEQALELSQKEGFLREEAMAYRNLGHAHNLGGRNKEAIQYLLKSLEIFERLDDTRSIVEVLGSLSKVNYDAMEFTRAIEYNMQSLQLAEKEANENNPVITDLEMAMLRGLMGISCSIGGEYVIAEEYLKKCVHSGFEIGLPRQAYQIFVKCLAEMYEFMGEYDSALVYTFMALEYLPKDLASAKAMRAQAEMGIGTIYNKLEKPAKGIPYLECAYEHYNTVGQLRSSYNSASALGDAYKLLGKNNTALNYYEIALENALLMRQLGSIFKNDTLEKTPYMGYQYFFPHMTLFKHEHMALSAIVYSQSNLYRYWRDMGQPSKSISYLLNYTLYKDTLNRLKKKEELEELQQKYEAEKMEQQVVILSQENQMQQSQIQKTRYLLIGLAAFVFMVVILGYVLIHQNSLKTEQDKLVLEQKLMRTQMNPHFIFNALAGIQNLIISQDAVKASIYLSRFSELVRSILNSSVYDYVILENEVKIIENYLELQKVRFPDRFDYLMEIDQHLNIESLKVPPMLAQPFIENAIEHGFKNRKTTGHLEIRFEQSEGKINLEIKDDGIGRAKAQELLERHNKNHISLATSITRERIRALNKKKREKIVLEIHDLEDEMGQSLGTLVIIKIPFVYQ